MPRSNHIRFHWSNRSVRPQFRPLNEPYRHGRPWWTVPVLVGVVGALLALGGAAYFWGLTGEVLVAHSGPTSPPAQPTAVAPVAQIVVAPTATAAPPSPTVQPRVGDEILRRRAAAEGARTSDVVPIVAAQRLAASPTPAPSPTAHAETTYVVRSGDTFSTIAESLGVPEAELAQLNGIVNRDRVRIGETLKVPPGASSAKAGSAGSRQAANSAAAVRPHFIWPSLGPITTEFGELGMVWIGGVHTGLDIAAPPGDPVLASEGGKVLEAGWSQDHGYGNYVLIDHGMGYRTLYGHLSAIRVKAGQTVQCGQLIGNVGSTGVSSGPHLHFEVQDWGKPVNPIPYIGSKQPTDRLKLPWILTAY